MQGRIFAAALAIALLPLAPAAAEWRLVGASCRIVDGRQICVPSHWHQTHLCCPACGYTPPTIAATPAVPAGRASEARPAMGPAASPIDLTPVNQELASLRAKLDEQSRALEDQGRALNAASDALKGLDTWPGELAAERRAREGADRDLATAVSRARADLARDRQTSDGKFTAIVADVSADLRAQIEATRREANEAAVSAAATGDGGGPAWWWDVAGAALTMAAGGAGFGLPVAIGWKLLGMGIGWRRQQRAQRAQQSDGAGQGDDQADPAPPVAETPAAPAPDASAGALRKCQSDKRAIAAERDALARQVTDLQEQLASARRAPRPVNYVNPPDTRDLDRMRRAMALVSEQYPASRTWVRMIENVYNLELSGENLNVDYKQPGP